MGVSYKKLWKMLIDKDMPKMKLCREAKISTNAMAKMGKGEAVRTENLASYINTGEAEAGNPDFDFARMSDADAEEARDGLVEEKGFFILPSELFCNVRFRASGFMLWNNLFRKGTEAEVCGSGSHWALRCLQP